METFFHSFTSMAFRKYHVINIYIIAYIQQTQIISAKYWLPPARETGERWEGVIYPFVPV